MFQYFYYKVQTQPREVLKDIIKLLILKRILRFKYFHTVWGVLYLKYKEL